MSDGIPFSPNAFTCKNVHFNKSWVWFVGLSLLLCYQYWTLIRTPLRYSAILLCIGKILQLWICKSFHALQKFIDRVDVFGVGQLKALDLGLGDS